jgi:predicted NAD/FAD-binding protein
MFGERVHPTFVRLVDALGLNAAVIEREMGTTVLEHGTDRPRFVSPGFGAPARLAPMFAPWNAPGQLAFLAFALASRRFERDGDWSIVLDDWLRGVRGLTAWGREQIILPWLSALTGCSIPEARTLSARAGTAVVSRALPPQLAAPYCWRTLRQGLASVVDALVARCTTLTVVPNAAVVAVEGERTPVLADGRRFPVDQLVLAAPPHAIAPLLRGRDDGLADALAACPTFASRLVVHTDPVYVHADPRHRSAYNVIRAGDRCEGCIWYGAIRDPLPDGTLLPLFKSWATARPVPATQVLASANFRHVLPTPALMALQSKVADAQGRGGVWFAGSWVIDVDLQETALRSAMAIAERLAPGASAALGAPTAR